jgi:hypothetical protein
MKKGMFLEAQARLPAPSSARKNIDLCEAQRVLPQHTNGLGDEIFEIVSPFIFIKRW